jgi:hypothetical protein
MANPETITMNATTRNDVSSADLISNLFALANNNHRFQRGVIDKVSFTIVEGDRAEDFTSDDEVSSEFYYAFNAQRMRCPGHRPEVGFTFSFNGEHTPVIPPTHLIVDQFGLEPEDASEDLIGRLTLKRTLEFIIDTGERKLNVCDRYTYLDEEGETVSEVCSCPPDPDGVMYLDSNDMQTDEDIDEEPDGELAVVSDGAINQIVFFSLRDRLNHESLPLDDVDDAQKLWSTTDTLDEALQAAIDYENLQLAARIFIKMKQALLAQAG